ncbi:hypothetical protein GOBAR_AA21515 [Gossypium barbadense]|uniref:Phorbol-ester/DAG-type domain-containing protein n=1 Tax=Gossypium barbadense TaxID=3634 RepID=A0A2P5X721_GOSBA|nr:hypothetical protein GOBAR_AA21515 [Gossypium barbadense]
MELHHHFSHQHPLEFIEEHNLKSKKANCSGCGELVSGTSYSCMGCEFYLDKKCFEASSEVNHPFHPNHSLKLLASPPYIGSWAICDFCDKRCEQFVYHCSCKLDFHIKCALFSKTIAENKVGELEGVSQKDLLVSSENGSEELEETECFACRKPVLDSPYISFDSRFYLHKKCLDLPIEVNHLFHSQHPLVLQFNSQRLPCQICKTTQPRGLVYCCSPCEFTLHIACVERPTRINHPCHRHHPLILQLNLKSLLCQICRETQALSPAYYCSACKFGLHVKCVSPKPSIKGEIHEHPFTLFWRQVQFICDACGTSGDCISYICSPCGLIVHESCISLPPIIKRFPRHGHSISHTFILGQYEIKSWKCKICLEEVNSKHGCYCCSDCNYVVHANCAIKSYRWYKIFDDGIEETGELLKNSAFVVIKETRLGENDVIPTEIKHLSHPHNLIFSNDVKDDKYCDGCVLFISSSVYHCAQCDFFLHKSCAELPKKLYIWGHMHVRPFTLNLHADFLCCVCRFRFNNCFSYDCNVCGDRYCVRCVQLSDTPTCQGHEHRLSYYGNCTGQCSGCGNNVKYAYVCKECKFAVEYDCLTLPDKIQHKCDEHPLMLTYGEDNIYSQYHYCDMCEKRRNPSRWFYHCAICDNSVHKDCVIDAYSYMKLGKTYTAKDHPHPLTFTRKLYDYPPECHICEEHCKDLSAECLENGCNYIVHWKCIDPYRKDILRLLRWRPKGEDKEVLE